MLFMLISQTRKDLTPDEFAQLGALAKQFYANVPDDVTLLNDWSALDRSCTFALMEAENQDVIDTIQAPFKPYVDVRVIAVREINGWEVS